MIGNYLRTLRLFNRNVRLYLVSGALIGFTTAGGIYGVLLNLYLLRLGYGLEFIGIISATGAISFAAFSLPAGALGRRLGTRWMMTAGMVLIVVGNISLPLAEFVSSSWQAEYLLLTRLPRAMGFAMYMVNASPFLMGATSAQERTHVFAVQAALWPLAGFAGSLAGGFLPGFFSSILAIPADGPEPYRYTLFVAGALLTPAVWALLNTNEVGVKPQQENEESAEPQQAKLVSGDSASAPWGAIVFIALVTLFQTAGFAGIQTFFNVYLDESLAVSTGLIGTLTATGQLFGGIAALATPVLAARLGHARLVLWGSLGTIFCFIPLVALSHWGMAGLAFVGISALTTIRFAAFAVYQQEMIGTRWRSMMSGATSMASGLSFSTISLVGGYLVPSLGYGSFFFLSAALTALGTIIFWIFNRVPGGAFATKFSGT